MNFAKIKYFSVAMIPYGMTFGSFCMLIIICINGLPGNFLGSILELDLTHLSIPAANFTSLTGLVLTSTDNVTAASVGLGENYAFYLWNYAETLNGEQDFKPSGLDYLGKIDFDTITVDGTTSPMPQYFKDIMNRFKTKIEAAQCIFLAAIINVFFVLLVGILACFGIKFKLFVVLSFAAISTALIIVFASLVTVASLKLDDVFIFFYYGMEIKVGAGDLGVNWLAVAHMLAVNIMFSLMGFGVMKMNPTIKQSYRERSHDEELLPTSSSTGDFSMQRK